MDVVVDGSTFQIFFYAVRPMFVKAQPLTGLHYLNILAQFIVDYSLVTTFGWKPLIYLLFSSFLAGSRSEEHTSELQSRVDLVCRLLLEKKKPKQPMIVTAATY